MTHPEGPVVLDPYTLPSDDNVNPYAFCVDLDGQWFLQKGKMIAYYGQVDFHAIGHGPLDHLVAANFHSPLHAAAWVVAQGRGKMLLADRSYDINSYDLDDGNLTIRSGNLLAFQPGLALKQSIIPGFLTLIGTGDSINAAGITIISNTTSAGIYLNGSADVAIPIRMYAPEDIGGASKCPFEIDWPHGQLKGYGAGMDDFQAIELTMQRIGLEIYNSPYHESGRLWFTQPGRGYGFPVPRTMRDELIGDDWVLHR